MIRERLIQLGFTLQQTDAGEQAVIDLLTPLINPLTRRFIETLTFRVQGTTLVPVCPVDVVGLPPISVAGLDRLSDFEAHLRGIFEAAIFQLQRRSAELQSLGIGPRIDPEALELRADIAGPRSRMVLGSDKQGNFRVISARLGDAPVRLPGQARFELSEFRDRSALVAYLEALVEDAQQAAPGAVPAPSGMADPLAAADWGAAFGEAPPELPVEAEISIEEPRPPSLPLTLGELSARFGERAVVPQRTSVEVVADLLVGGKRYRFAASRVSQRSFRGLLGGPVGKVWAERFELDAFPGIVELAASKLEVAPTEVEVLGLEVESFEQAG
jgi:hypothetical protein